jgi:membrane protein YdbS with pleckstrin-like domain
MPLAVVCPHCGKPGKVPDTTVGKTVRCPVCKGAFRAEDQEEEPRQVVSSFVRDGLPKGERVVYVAGLHWGIFAKPVVSGFVALVLMALLIRFRRDERVVVLFPIGDIALALSAAAFFFGPVVMLLFRIIRYLTNDFVVTNQRVLVKQGVLARRSLEILLVKVESVSVSQPILGRVFGYGTVRICGTGGTKESFPGIASPLELSRNVREQISTAGRA